MCEESRICRIYHLLAWLVAISLLLGGSLVYMLFRPQNLLMFNVLDKIGILSYLQSIRLQVDTVKMPEFIVYSLPGGLWTTSYLLMMFLLTKYHTCRMRLLLALPLPILTIVEEFMQLLGWCPGTFDIDDIICYIVPLSIFILSVK